MITQMLRKVLEDHIELKTEQIKNTEHIKTENCFYKRLGGNCRFI